MDKLLKMLDVQKLDEDKQKAIKEKLETLIELKVKEAIDEKLETEKENLIKEYEDKFEAYKDDITTKFSNFVDGILDEQMVVPDKVLEYARKGELYSDLIEQFKVRLGVDEGLLDEEVKSLLKEAKSEIQDLRSKLDKSISENLEIKGDAQDLASQLYIREKCDGLTVEQSNHVTQILEGIKDKEEIDKKFDIVLEAYNGKTEDEEDKEEDKDKKKKKKEKEDEMEESSNKDGKGQVMNEDNKNDNLNEDKEPSPFDMFMKSYVKTLQENKI